MIGMKVVWFQLKFKKKYCENSKDSSVETGFMQRDLKGTHD
jgi:hypothetical protein